MTLETMDEVQYTDVTLLDLVDRLLDRGVVLTGDLILSVAGIDLVNISIKALLASADRLEGCSRQ